MQKNNHQKTEFVYKEKEKFYSPLKINDSLKYSAKLANLIIHRQSQPKLTGIKKILEKDNIFSHNLEKVSKINFNLSPFNEKSGNNSKKIKWTKAYLILIQNLKYLPSLYLGQC